MSQSLSERIALNTDKSKNTRKQFLPVFLALKPDIEHALNDGWTTRQIWMVLHDEGKITCSYQWFRTLINRHISADKKEGPCLDKKALTSNHDHDGFRFNSSTEKEELV